jgi:hypothetical protein
VRIREVLTVKKTACSSEQIEVKMREIEKVAATEDVRSARAAHEAIRPAQPLQIVQAVVVSPEPRLELAERPRIVDTGTKRPHHHRNVT